MSAMPPPAPYREPLFNAEQMSIVTGLNRSTVQGWIARYEGYFIGIGILPITKGATRRFTMEQIGFLALLRVATSIKQADGVFDAMTEICERAEGLYRELIDKMAWEDIADGQKRLRLPVAETPRFLEGRPYLGSQWVFSVKEKPTVGRGVYVKDTMGFPTPVVVLELDETLRNAWVRTMNVALGLVKVAI